jgi:hypothetical protein
MNRAAKAADQALLRWLLEYGEKHASAFLRHPASARVSLSKNIASL